MTPARPAEPSAGHDAPGAGLPLLLSLAMAQFMVVLDFTIVNVALPSIQGELHVATTTLQWLISAYAVTFGGFLLLGGRLADSYGRARLLTATRQCGSALGVAIVSATLVAVHGSDSHRTAVTMLVTAGFALAGLLATRVVPPGPPHPRDPQPHHLFRHHAGGIP
jgi:MFS family permease